VADNNRIVRGRGLDIRECIPESCVPFIPYSNQLHTSIFLKLSVGRKFSYQLNLLIGRRESLANNNDSLDLISSTP